MPGGSADRRRIPFRAVNLRGQPGYQCGMQRHHMLPSSGEAAVRMALPLHRGQHRIARAIAERVGQIESTWTTLRSKAPEWARDQALMRLTLLKRALRRRLLRPDRPRLRLNRRDPPGALLNFTEIDAMAEMLWAGTTSVNVPQ